MADFASFRAGLKLQDNLHMAIRLVRGGELVQVRKNLEILVTTLRQHEADEEAARAEIRKSLLDQLRDQLRVDD